MQNGKLYGYPLRAQNIQKKSGHLKYISLKGSGMYTLLRMTVKMITIGFTFLRIHQPVRWMVHGRLKGKFQTRLINGQSMVLFSSIKINSIWYGRVGKEIPMAGRTYTLQS